MNSHGQGGGGGGRWAVGGICSFKVTGLFFSSPPSSVFELSRRPRRRATQME